MQKLVLVFMALIFTGALSARPIKDPVVQISTTYGEIRLQLFHQTPLHTRNFIRLVKKGYFDGTLFHRVIRNFMIQGGDPDSRNAKPGQLLGDGGPKYTIPFEYNPALFHKKGMLAAARESDDVNPLRASSASQFYIVVGKVFDDAGLAKQEQRINTMQKNNLMYRYIADHPQLKEQLEAAKKNDTLSYGRQMTQLGRMADSLYALQKPYVIPEAEREVYKTLGGTPHLDASYSIFGQVVEGMEVVEKISLMATDPHDRPLENVVMKIRVLKKKDLKKNLPKTNTL